MFDLSSFKMLMGFSLLFISLSLDHSTLVHTRSFPATASRHFRFPEEQNLDRWNSLKNSNVIDDKNAHHGRNNIPISSHTNANIIVPRSEINDKTKSIQSSGEFLSSDAVIIRGVEEMPHSIPESEPAKRKSEDGELQEVLCPTQNNTKTDGDVEDESISPEYEYIRYDLRAGKCAHVGRKEHCGENMIFVADLESLAYGYCECDFENKIKRETGKNVDSHSRTPLVFHEKSDSCYRLYEQAFCKDGEWLILSREKKSLVCEPKKCPSDLPIPSNILNKSPGVGGGRSLGGRRKSKLLTPSLWKDDNDRDTIDAQSPPVTLESQIKSDKSALWVPLNGTGPCVQLNKENPEYCHEGEQIIFNVGGVLAKCGVPGRRPEARAVIYNACPPGSFFSIIGRCQPDWDF